MTRLISRLRPRRGDEGVVVLFALLFITILAFVIGIALTQNFTVTATAGAIATRDNVQYSLDAGVERAITAVRMDALAAPLSTTVSGGGITSLSVASLPSPVFAGEYLQLSTGSGSAASEQIVVAAGSVAASTGSAAIPVASFTANATYPGGPGGATVTADLCPVPATLSSGLSSGSSYSSLTVSAVNTPITSGDQLLIGSGATSQTVTAAQSVGLTTVATTFNVAAFVAGTGFPAATTRVVDLTVGQSPGSNAPETLSGLIDPGGFKTNGVPANYMCQTMAGSAASQSQAGLNAQNYAIITTSTAANSLTTQSGSSNPLTVTGSVYVRNGSLTSIQKQMTITSGDLLAYTASLGSPCPLPATSPQAISVGAGYASTCTVQPLSGTDGALPPSPGKNLPTTLPDNVTATSWTDPNGCVVLLPGTYTNNPVGGASSYFLASGLYYFNGNFSVTINGTAVDAGQSRTVTDASLTSGSNLLTSSSAKFSAGDAGLSLAGPGIPAGTVISSASGTQAVMSAAATASGTNQPVSIGNGYGAGWRGDLTTAVTSGKKITSLSVNPLPTAIANGDKIQIGSTNETTNGFQQVTASAAAAAGATTISVKQFTAANSFAAGTPIYDLNNPQGTVDQCQGETDANVTSQLAKFTSLPSGYATSMGGASPIENFGSAYPSGYGAMWVMGSAASISMSGNGNTYGTLMMYPPPAALSSAPAPTAPAVNIYTVQAGDPSDFTRWDTGSPVTVISNVNKNVSMLFNSEVYAANAPVSLFASNGSYQAAYDSVIAQTLSLQASASAGSAPQVAAPSTEVTNTPVIPFRTMQVVAYSGTVPASGPRVTAAFVLSNYPAPSVATPADQIYPVGVLSWRTS